MQKRSSSISSSAEEVAGSVDTLTEILLRLPAKPLLRFKCVSKQWLSLISDPRFCHSHALRRHLHAPSALLLSDHFRQAPNFPIVPLTSSDSNVRLLNLDFLNRAHVTVVRSCNGLLICYSPPSSQQNPSSRYFVCNPATRKFVTLSFPNQQFGNQIRSLYLGFDPLRSPHFEVISIRILNGPQIRGAVKCEINVYSSGTGSWSVPGICLSAPVCMTAGGGVYYNRAIHWCNGAGETLYFDIDSQCLKILQVPLNRAEYRGIWGTESQTVRYFGESGGHLHLILSKRKESLEFDLWELREYSSGWSFRHHVDLKLVQVEFPDLKWDLGNFVQPFYIVCKAEEENSMFVFLVGGTAISCNPANCSSRKICDFKPDMTLLDAVMYDLSVEIFQYFESLSCFGAFTAYS